MTALDSPIAGRPYDRHHRRLPGGGFTCERLGCTHVNGRPELLQRDLAEELVDVG
ncbi:MULTISPECIES: hypothetical protein [Salinispora]|uniref:hypothetical protein n=1 Tax=Salinispora TaxID=168694 RepID=UPI000378E8BE|nr:MULTISPECIES: hypothetical protein [Salinispora]NYT96183.1 hypothetical protein [Salinispora sp. H7-4]